MIYKNSIAKDIVRENYFRFLDKYIKTIPKDVADWGMVLFLPGEEGIEISKYLKRGFKAGNLVGLENKNEYYNLMKAKNWGINLVNSDFSGLLKIIFDHIDGNNRIDCNGLVEGNFKDLLNKDKIPYFPIMNLDLLSDCGNFIYSFENAILDLHLHTGVLSITAQAKRDPLSFECLNELKCLLQIFPHLKSVFNKSYEKFLIYSKGNIVQANRLFLREILILSSVAKSVSTAKKVGASASAALAISKKLESLINKNAKIHIPEEIEEVSFSDVSIDYLSKSVKNENELKKWLNNIIENKTKVKKLSSEIIRLFDTDPILDVLDVLDKVQGDNLRTIKEVYKAPIISSPLTVEKTIYHNEVGTPMINWNIMKLNDTSVKNVVGFLERAVKVSSDFFFHVDRNGMINLISDNGLKHLKKLAPYPGSNWPFLLPLEARKNYSNKRIFELKKKEKNRKRKRMNKKNKK